jgi:hypothetical protein
VREGLARLPSLAAKRSGETRLATPVLYQASIEAGEAAAERIARALEETFDPSPVAVGAFELGKGRFEVFAHFAEAPPRDALLALIEHAQMAYCARLCASSKSSTKIG